MARGDLLHDARASASPIDVLDGLTEFVAVVEAGSITAAARALSLPRETVGKRLAKLEERLSVRLLHRTTRRLSPSQAGRALYDRARRIVADGIAAAEAVRQLDGVPRGRLRVTIPPGDANRDFADLIRTFTLAYPAVDLEILASTRHIDLVAEGFDVALRAGTVRDPSLVSRSLLRAKLVAVAAQSYLARRGTPQRPEDLADHECLRALDAEQLPVRSWPLRDGGSVPVQGRIAVNDLSVLLGLALSGLGIALLPELLARSALEDHSLEAILPEVGTQSQIAVVFPERDLLDPKVRAFVEHTVAFFEGRAC